VKTIQTIQTIYGAGVADTTPEVLALHGVKFGPTRRIVVLAGAHKGIYLGIPNQGGAWRLEVNSAFVTPLFRGGPGRYVLEDR
jgi:hypothetical protein